MQVPKRLIFCVTVCVCVCVCVCVLGRKLGGEGPSPNFLPNTHDYANVTWHRFQLLYACAHIYMGTYIQTLDWTIGLTYSLDFYTFLVI